MSRNSRNRPDDGFYAELPVLDFTDDSSEESSSEEEQNADPLDRFAINNTHINYYPTLLQMSLNLPKKTILANTV